MSTTKSSGNHLEELLARLTVPAADALVEHLPDGKIRCLSCGHRCRIAEGAHGVCYVRFVRDGVLRVPSGYVGALQVDPVEKKPFFHVLPGSQALSFGMLGCDLHCAYCFTPETRIVTDRGVLAIANLFSEASEVIHHGDAEIAFSTETRVVSGTGRLRNLLKVFRHGYRGPLSVIRPYYLPPLRCTPDHKVYATSEPGRVPPAPIAARDLSHGHHLAVPTRQVFPQPEDLDVSAPLSVRGRRFETRKPLLDRTPSASATAVVSCELTEARSRTRLYAGDDLGEKCVTTDDYCLVPLRSIDTEPYDGDVYNLEVEDEHSYLAGFFAVRNCQNWITSQALRDRDAVAPPRIVTSGELASLAVARHCPIVVSTYNEPLITAEWAHEVFGKAREAGCLTGFVSNGNGTPEVLRLIRPVTDLYKIDLKGFDDRRYRSLGAPLKNVLDTIVDVKALGFWLEVVTLIVPGFNDGEEELRGIAKFLASVDPTIPWHVTAFHPDYKMNDRDRTGAVTLLRAHQIGREEGLKFVYAGNAPGDVGDRENTKCPGCGETLIRRRGFRVLENRLEGGDCPSCGERIPGVFSIPGRC